jgi:hypothetical protein
LLLLRDSWECEFDQLSNQRDDLLLGVEVEAGTPPQGEFQHPRGGRQPD